MNSCVYEGAGGSFTPIGSVIKMTVEVSYSGDPSITPDDMDFYVEYYCIPSRVLRIEKDDLIREVFSEEGVETVNWYALVNTETVGKGALKFRVCAEVPDSDAPGGVRPEVAEYDTGEVIA